MPDTTFQSSLIRKPSDDKILKRQSNAAEKSDLIRLRAAWTPWALPGVRLRLKYG